MRASHTAPEIFAAWRLWLAVIPLGILVAVRSRRDGVSPFWAPAMSRLRWALILLGAGAAFVAGMITGFSAIDDASLLDATLIGSLQPIVIVGFAVAFLHERAQWSLIVARRMAIAGTVLVAVSSPSGPGRLSGNLLAVASMIFSAGWFLYGRILRDRFGIDRLSLMLCVLTTSALLVTPLALASHGSLRISPAGFGYAAATMGAGTTAHVFVVWAHRFLPTSVSAPLLLAEPPIVGLGAWACFGQKPAELTVLGSAVVLAALWGVVRSPAVTHVEEQAPDPVSPA